MKMNISKKIRLLEKLAQQPMMPPQAAGGPAPEMMQPEPPPEEMPGGDPEGAVDKLEMLMETLTSAGADAAKFDAGNSAAGTRLRKKALEASKQLKSLRAEVQSVKSSRKEEKVMAVMQAMAEQAQAAQAQQRMEQEQNKAPADKLFDPGQQQQQPMMPPQGAMPQEQPKVAMSKEKRASLLAALKALPGRAKTYLFGGPMKGGQMTFGGARHTPGLFNKKLGDLTVGDKLLALGGGAAALTAGIRGTDAAIDAVRNPLQKRKAFNNMIEDNPSLAQEDKKDMGRIFNTLYSFNPKMAKDPLVAGSFMRRSLQFRDEGIQPQDVKTLAEIKKLQGDASNKESLLQAMMGAGLAGV